MLTRQEKKQYRTDLFRHLDGLVVVPVAWALYKKGVLQPIAEAGEKSLIDLTQAFEANEGYLHVALRLMASQGWLLMDIQPGGSDVLYRATPRLTEALALMPAYAHAVELLEVSGHFHERRFEREPFEVMKRLFTQYQTHFGWDISDETGVAWQMFKHIEGYLVGPSTVRLGMSGMFHKYFMEASFSPDEFHKDAVSFAELLDIFTWMGWFTTQNDHYRFTGKGLFFAQRASAYGVTVSYLPMFRRIDDLLFGDPTCLRPAGYQGPELHVDREMNVWGSGGAHSAYFKQVDDIIIDLFNKPIQDQPRGILDMGCGNGAFIAHIFDVIEQRTLRGKMLEEYPLFLVGADYNEAALKVTRANLIQADVWAKVIWGDIGRPDLLARDLKENYGISLDELLNVRTFLDHNRIWTEPATSQPDDESSSTGAYAYQGRRLLARDLEKNLLEHLQRWAPYVGRFGLLIIELHTIDPALAAAHPGQTAVTAYDGTHGFSDQYIVEIDVLHKVAAKAGLHLVREHFHRYPDSELATISINLFKAR
jgi:hypothetical protein